MNIFVCLLIVIGIIIAIWLIGSLIEWICDKLGIDVFAFLGLISIICVLTLFLYILTN